jgi:hypothetical protein
LVPAIDPVANIRFYTMDNETVSLPQMIRLFVSPGHTLRSHNAQSYRIRVAVVICSAETCVASF